MLGLLVGLMYLGYQYGINDASFDSTMIIITGNLYKYYIFTSILNLSMVALALFINPKVIVKSMMKIIIVQSLFLIGIKTLNLAFITPNDNKLYLAAFLLGLACVFQYKFEMFVTFELNKKEK